jgi:hypothetical protein
MPTQNDESTKPLDSSQVSSNLSGAIDWTKERKFTLVQPLAKKQVIKRKSARKFSADFIFKGKKSFNEIKNMEKKYNSDTEVNTGTNGDQDNQDFGKTGIKKFFNMLKHQWISVTHKNNRIQIAPVDSEQRILELITLSKQYGVICEKDKFEIANLIRANKGIPSEIRKDLWMLCTGATRAKLNNPNYYSTYSEIDYFEDGDKSDSLNYENSKLAYPLLQSYGKMPDIHKRQIELDLDRTFAEYPKFIINNPKNYKKMSNILRSYSKRNAGIGYCQGMNYVAATLFRVVDDEEDTFWLLCNLLESILPLDYYSQMIEVIVDQKVFVNLLQSRKPELFKHLSNMGLDFAIILFQWFICIFSSQLNREATE